MSVQLWLIRHGETTWSRSGRHTGRTDLPLTDAGQEAAAVLGRVLQQRQFALVLTSPLQRARETCRLAGYGAAAQLEPNLREWDYGDYEGRSTAEIRKNLPKWNLWDSGVPNGETIHKVAERARAVIDRSRMAGGEVALFAHGHILRILAACWLGLPPDAGRLFALDTASISVLGYERDTPVIRRWNDTVGVV